MKDFQVEVLVLFLEPLFGSDYVKRTSGLRCWRRVPCRGAHREVWWVVILVLWLFGMLSSLSHENTTACFDSRLRSLLIWHALRRDSASGVFGWLGWKLQNLVSRKRATRDERRVNALPLVFSELKLQLQRFSIRNAIVVIYFRRYTTGWVQTLNPNTGGVLA